jgi:hypothetical protein
MAYTSFPITWVILWLNQTKKKKSKMQKEKLAEIS